MALDPAGFIAALRLHEKLVLLTLSERYGLFTRLGLDSTVGAALLAELHFTSRIRTPASDLPWFPRSPWEVRFRTGR